MYEIMPHFDNGEPQKKDIICFVFPLISVSLISPLQEPQRGQNSLGPSLGIT